MNDNEQTKLMILGVISTLTPEQQKIVKDTKDAIQKLCNNAGEGLGDLALALAGVEK